MIGRINAGHASASKRGICSCLGFRRGVLYDKQINSHYRHSDESIVQLMKKVRRSNPTWGFRMIFAFLKNKGEKMGKMRVHRLYKDAGLSLHRTPKKVRLKRVSRNYCHPGK